MERLLENMLEFRSMSFGTSIDSIALLYFMKTVFVENLSILYGETFRTNLEFWSSGPLESLLIL